MDPKPVNGLNVIKGTLGILPDIGRILKGIYYLASAKTPSLPLDLALTIHCQSRTAHPTI